MGWLTGNAVLVTGGAGGLGRALAQRFIEEGAQVAILDRSRERSDAIARELGVLAVVGDVTSLPDNRRAVAETVKRFGKLDCFVGNAGIFDFMTSLAGLPLKELAEPALALGKLPEARDYTGAYVMLASSGNSSTLTGTAIVSDSGLGVRGFGKAAGGEDLE